MRTTLLAILLSLPVAHSVSDDIRQIAQPIASGFGAGAYPLGSVFVAPRRSEKPKYPSTAIAANLSGNVALELVVAADGSVRDLRVTKSAGTSALDDAATAALRQWRFDPVRVDGKPAAAVVAAEVVFQLRKDGRKVVGDVVADIDWDNPAIYEETTPGLVKPRATHDRRPQYTSEAMRERIQGSVELEIVVSATGRVARVRVLKSLDAVYGLDDAAMRAAREWAFSPATLNGSPVACRAGLVLEFRIH